MKIELCNESYPRVDIYVTAELIDDKLKISVQDIGKACEDIFGDSDYEYFYDFDRENTSKLFKSMSEEHEENNLDLLYRDYHGADGCKKLREYCKENDISFSFFSY